MSENNKVLLALFTGAATVAILGLLVSSEKANEIRREVIDAAKYFSDKIINKEREVAENAEKEFETENY